ncbi:hypothetical protein SPD48_04725 [Pseudogracilibacillus sp. SE30717A]|uniref:hypothetical protein n=1 Tax=Pseudogracilibacillus sp. SE30717A TaxID=3098293 RepID=UPI00300E42F3
MQNKNSDTISDEIIQKLSNYFNNKIGTYSVYNMMDEPYIAFNIIFDLYNYYIINFSYDRGSIGCSIIQGKYGIDLENSQQWYDTADMDVFLQELEQQIELRIPDKFLEFHGWK